MVGFTNQLSQQVKNLDQNEKQKLHDDYLKALEENKKKALEAKMMNQMEDQNMLDQQRKNMRDSQRAQKERNRLYAKELGDVADYHHYIKNQLAAEQKQKEDEEYLKGCQRENQKRDKEQEEWYNRYKKFSNDMDDRLKTTLAQAKPTLARKAELERQIEENADKYGNRIFDDYEKGRNEMKAKWKNAYNENQRNLNDKTRQQHLNKLKDDEERELQCRESLAYNQGEEQKRKELENQRHLYRETLQNQMSLNALNKYNYGKMTLQEKHLNKEDLRSFKNKDRNTVHALVPGIKNLPSIGTKPLMRGAMNVMDFGDSPPQGIKGRKGQMFFSPEPKQSDQFRMDETYHHPLPHQATIVKNKSGFIRRPNTPGSSIHHSGPVSKTDFERFKNNTNKQGHSIPYTSRNAYSMASFNGANSQTLPPRGGSSMNFSYNPIVHPVDKSYKLYKS